MNWITDADPYLPQPSDFMEVNKAEESTDPLELRRLSRARDEQVRARVSSNPNTPDDVLVAFKNDTKFVKLYLLRNPKLSIEFVKSFIGDEDKMIQLQAYNLLLDNYKKGNTDLTGKELYTIVAFLAPNEPNLTMAELLEDIRDTRERFQEEKKHLLKEHRNGHSRLS